MSNIEKIKEVIEAEMAEIEAGEEVKRSDSYFMLERFLSRYRWKCWKRGADSYKRY